MTLGKLLSDSFAAKLSPKEPAANSRLQSNLLIVMSKRAECHQWIVLGGQSEFGQGVSTSERYGSSKKWKAIRRSEEQCFVTIGSQLFVGVTVPGMDYYSRGSGGCRPLPTSMPTSPKHRRSTPCASSLAMAPRHRTRPHDTDSHSSISHRECSWRGGRECKTDIYRPYTQCRREGY